EEDRGDDDQIDYDGRRIFGQNHFRGAHRRGEEPLDGTHFPLLGEESHRDEREKNKISHPEPARRKQIVYETPRTHLQLHRLHHADEQPAVQEGEKSHHHVGQRREKKGSYLFAEKDEKGTHLFENQSFPSDSET